NREDTNGTDEQSLILKVRHETASGTLSWVTRAADFDNGYDAFSLDNLRTTLSDEPGHDQHKMVAHGATWQQPLGSLELEAQLSHVSSELLYGYDEDWAYPEIHPFSYSSTDEYARDRDRSSLTLSLSSLADVSRDRPSWTGGVHLANQSVALKRTYTFLPGPYTSRYDYQTRSLFGEISLPISASVQLVAGARLERRSQSFSDSESVQFRPEDSLWSGRLALQWDLAAETMAYLSISRGVKSGGFNTDGTLPASLRRFDPESLIEVESGLRAKLADDRLQLKAALFRADRIDQQIKSSRVTPREDGSTEFVDYLGNAAEGVNQGLEIEARFLVSERWQGRFALGLLDTEFDRFINEFGEDYSGREQAHAPRYTAQGSLNYSAERFNVQIGIEGKDDFYFSDRHNVRSSDYLVVNVSSTLHFDAFDLSIWGRNLTDETIYTRGFGSFGNDPRKDYATEPYFQFGEPRVWGMTLTAQLAGQ
ncbi:MAG: TonB-dependent receptor, partial [Gammaproteobacteria bacterium]|nr:TonB-dependent receptor [Gammaproteobacteria bacterium]